MELKCLSSKRLYIDDDMDKPRYRYNHKTQSCDLMGKLAPNNNLEVINREIQRRELKHAFEKLTDEEFLTLIKNA